jgi:hypothetical protein
LMFVGAVVLLIGLREPRRQTVALAHS